MHGKPLDLTYKEFQLLHFFATHPSRVFTREQLLSEVWGYDYFGGTRTVDVHVRRLRAKLGDLEQLIGTVRNVGYRFNVYEDDQLPHRQRTRSLARPAPLLVHTHVTSPCNDEGMIEHEVLDAGLGDADDDDFDLSEAFDSQLPDNRYLDRELSWLAFNQRVLELAEDPDAAGARAGELPRDLRQQPRRVLHGARRRAQAPHHHRPRRADQRRARPAGGARRHLGRRARAAAAPRRCLDVARQPALADAGHRDRLVGRCDDDERDKLYDYFHAQVFPVLMPLAVDPAHPFPYISGLSLNLAIRIRNARTGRQEFARLKVPPMLPRFVEVCARRRDRALPPARRR